MNQNEKEKRKIVTIPLLDQCLQFVDYSKGWPVFQGDFLKEEGRQKTGSTIFLPPGGGDAKSFEEYFGDSGRLNRNLVKCKII